MSFRDHFVKSEEFNVKLSVFKASMSVISPNDDKQSDHCCHGELPAFVFYQMRNRRRNVYVLDLHRILLPVFIHSQVCWFSAKAGSLTLQFLPISEG